MTTVTELAARLDAALTSRRPVAPLTETHPALTLDDAYAIQLAQVEARIACGRRIVGHKIGLTSRAMQELLGVDEPDYGHLFDDMAVVGSVDPAAFLQPRIEPEIAFILGADLPGPGIDLESAAAAVEWVVPALEIVDSRIADWRIGLFDTIADNASSGAFVLGEGRVRLTDLDLPATVCTLFVDGDVAGTGTGAAVLGTPLAALSWLGNTLGERGIALRQGDIVLPGALCSMVPLRAGSTIRADFSGLGSVEISVAGERR